MLLFLQVYQTKICVVFSVAVAGVSVLQQVFYFRSTIYLNNVISILMAQTIEFKYRMQENIQYVHCKEVFF